MKKIKYFHVDAFTSEAFKGNPAGVCVLDAFITTEEMQQIAAELNHSETAFVVKGSDPEHLYECPLYQLRWFTPEVEVTLCGHATLAASKVLHNEYGIEKNCITYNTLSGLLYTRISEHGITMNFPKASHINIEPSEQLLWYMGISHYERAIYSEDLHKIIIELSSEKDLRRLVPDFEKLRRLDLELDIRGVAVTCKGNGKYDFMTRYFNPWLGVDEDPVTGSVHTILASYWGEILDKKDLIVYQASKRGGEIYLSLTDDGRVELSGEAVVIMDGELRLNEL
jgi:PhzF family phenazine biosynthesis protein